jgi:hypothetical protein
MHRNHSSESFSSLSLAVKAMTRFGPSSRIGLDTMSHSNSTQALYRGALCEGLHPTAPSHAVPAPAPLSSRPQPGPSPPQPRPNPPTRSTAPPHATPTPTPPPQASPTCQRSSPSRPARYARRTRSRPRSSWSTPTPAVPRSWWPSTGARRQPGPCLPAGRWACGGSAAPDVIGRLPRVWELTRPPGAPPACRPPMPILTLVVPRLVSDSLHWRLEGK